MNVTEENELDIHEPDEFEAAWMRWYNTDDEREQAELGFEIARNIPALIEKARHADRSLVENAVRTMLTASELFTREGVEIWLKQPNRMLKGRSPIDLLVEGSKEPWRLAEALADGAVI